MVFTLSSQSNGWGELTGSSLISAVGLRVPTPCAEEVLSVHLLAHSTGSEAHLV